jgi:hypothetical protein
MKARSSFPAGVLSTVTGGFIIGCLDLAYAIVVYSPKAPILIPQTIASGILGRVSYAEGTSSAVLGVICHFFIACCVAAVYYAASRRLPILVERAVPWGMAYGLTVYCVMHGLVLPLSNAPHHPIPPIYVITEFIEHAFFVGLPAALTTRYFSLRAAAGGSARSRARSV